VQDEREACEAFLQGQGEVDEGIDREVLSQGWGGNFLSPAEGAVYEERPCVRCLEESWALKEEREGKDSGSLAEAGLAYGGAHATLRAAKRLLLLKYEMIGGRHASPARMEVGVEKKLFVAHHQTRCRKLFMPLSAVYVRVRRSAPYVSMGQRRPVVMR